MNLRFFGSVSVAAIVAFVSAPASAEPTATRRIRRGEVQLSLRAGEIERRARVLADSGVDACACREARRRRDVLHRRRGGVRRGVGVTVVDADRRTHDARREDAARLRPADGEGECV